MSSGSTTNNASDGIVNTVLVVNVVTCRRTALRHTSAPHGTAIARPTSTGTNDIRRWITVSVHASGR